MSCRFHRKHTDLFSLSGWLPAAGPLCLMRPVSLAQVTAKEISLFTGETTANNLQLDTDLPPVLPDMFDAFQPDLS